MFRRTETMSISEFLHGKEKPVHKIHPAAYTAIPVGLMAAHPVFAASNVVTGPAVAVAGETTKQTIMHAFDPLVQMITTISYPVAAVMITGSALMIMLGMKEKGYSTMQTASIGFILVQMAPLFLKILFGIGAAV